VKYFVRLAERDFEVEVVGPEVRVDGTSFPAALLRVPGTPLYQLVAARRSRSYALVRAEDAWRVQRGGEVWTAEVVDERARVLRALRPAGSKGDASGLVRAPMPGLVLRVEVEVGQQVAAGSGLVVLEAMKMENEIRAAGAGTVQAVLVEVGQAVEKGAVLVEVATHSPEG
jgi:biotin carboxyl carrier protein